MRWAIISAAVFLAAFCHSTKAATIITGDVTPPLPWGNGTTARIGNPADGTLAVDGGDQLLSRVAYLGYGAGARGMATITGTGSKWTNSGNLLVGYYGSGSLTVADGGAVEAETIYASLDNLFGDGAITVTQGVVLDADLRFDATQGTQQTLAFGSDGKLTFNIAGGPLGVGYQHNGTLTVAEGVNVTSSSGYLGYDSGSTGTATVTGASSQWNSRGKLYVGHFGNGSLTIEAGGQVSNSDGYLGYGSGPTNTATVTGAGSKWTNSGALFVDLGSLIVADGGEVGNRDGYLGYYSGSTGTATVTGAGSKWTNSGALTVGNEGSGSLTVADGGEVSSRVGYLGYERGSTGTATVTGAGSKWTNSYGLYVGPYNRSEGSGSLTVSDGGVVETGVIYASLDNLFGDGAITVTEGGVVDADLRFDATHGTQQTLAFGSGGTLTFHVAGGPLGVGYQQNGTLTVAEGVSLTSSDGYLGYAPGSTGTATVTGAGSKWNSSRLYIGREGSGSLTIEAGGQVSNTSYGSLRYGTVKVTGAGSKWSMGYDLYVGSNGTLYVESGALVGVGGRLTIHYDDNNESFINLATGGMLALYGEADGSITEFLDLVEGTDAICYWDTSLHGWASIADATYGDDYTLEYLTSGDLAGYTLLTVYTPTPIPEPTAVVMLGFGAMLFAAGRRSRY
jgi:T5SS/PEP-CTERM-associated repeat protein